MSNTMEPETLVNPDTKLCPKCGADWTGQEIPEADRPFYGGTRTHFSRLLGVYRGSGDRITEWVCPDCNETFPRE